MKISNIEGDNVNIVASYGPARVDTQHRYTCRGRTIYRTNLRDTDTRGTYRYCQFEDSRLFAWINEDNIRGVKVKGVGLIEVTRDKAAA